MEIYELNKMATQVRRDILRMVSAAHSGHPGGAMSCADYIVDVFFSQMNVKPENFSMEGKGEDVFYLSNGHVCPALYSVLARKGYFDTSELATLRALGSRLQGHPSTSHNLPGIRIASGSLGQGLSVAVGHALEKKMSGDKSMVYSLHGDGELQEGQIWEAAMFAAAHHVDNIISAIDNNNQQIDGRVDDVISLGNLKGKWEAFGWYALSCDGNNISSIEDTLAQAKQHIGQGQPIVIILNTKMGYGVDFMLDDNKWHGTVPDDEQLERALGMLEETLGDY